MCKSVVVRYVCITSLFIASAVPAISENTNRACRVEVQLVDGSSIVGVPKASTLPFHNAFAKFNIDLKRIQAVQFRQDTNAVTVNLLNGDVLTAEADFNEIALNTLFGPAVIKLLHVQAIEGSASSVPRKGLIAEYLFSGNANDSSGNKGHGTVHGATLAEDRFGNKDQAYAFNGENQWIEAADSVLTNPLDAITISAWVKPAAFGEGNMVLVSKQPSGYCSAHPSPTTSNHGGLFDMEIGNKIFSFSSQVSDSLSTEGIGGPCPDLGDGKWHHVVMAAENTTRIMDLYVDGKKISSNPVKQQLFRYATKEPLRLGFRKDSPGMKNYFKGVMDDILIYDRVLKEDEIRRLYYIEPSIDKETTDKKVE